MANESNQTKTPKDTLDILGEIAQQGRLVLQLLLDERVPAGVKLIPLIVLVYILSPLDLIPDMLLGLGQVDDLAVFLLGLKIFLQMCPQGVLQQYRKPTKSHRVSRSAKKTQSPQAKEIIDVPYRVVEDD